MDFDPQVGDGVTVYYYSDRAAGTIVRRTPKMVIVQLDTATRTDKNGMSELQTYTYAPDPKGAFLTFRLTKRGWTGSGVRLGAGRHSYYDYSF